MENERIPILLIEDSPTDAFLYCEALEGAIPASFQVTIAERLDLGLEQLKTHHFEAILLDLGLPDSQGLDTFHTVYKEHPEIPIIVLSGWGDEDLALEAVQAGAQDYLVKGKVSRESVVRVVRYAIQRQRSQVALRESENRFRSLFEHAPVAYLSLDAEGRLIDFNTQMLEMLGYEPQELNGRSFGELWSPETRAAFPGKFARFKRDGKINADLQLLKKDGTVIEAALEGEIQNDANGQFARLIVFCMILPSGSSPTRPFVRARSASGQFSVPARSGFSSPQQMARSLTATRLSWICLAIPARRSSAIAARN